MDKRFGYVLIILSIIIGAVAAVNKIVSENVIVAVVNQTGSCYIGSTCLHDQSNILLFSFIAIVAVMFVIGLVILILESRKKSEKKEIKKEPEANRKVLNDEQKKIYEILLNSDGSMLQGELVEKSGMNKVRVSRILDKLEMQGIIERRRHGMSNVVLLKKN
ncbi:MAG: MarR family transcriptional regulator [Candidatus Aenigmatarchaeota archaeon]